MSETIAKIFVTVIAILFVVCIIATEVAWLWVLIYCIRRFIG